jgi:hypothetical protein
MLADPSALAAAAGVLVDQTAGYDLAELERWAVSRPYQRLDPQEQAAELARSRRAGKPVQQRDEPVEGNDDNL